jgi:predicted RNase H-like HicB family nuclease
MAKSVTMSSATPAKERLEAIVAGKVSLNVIFRKAEIDGGYIAECLELPGCMSQGDTEDEAKANIVDAIESYISVLLEDAINANVLNRLTDLRNVERSETLVVDPCLREVLT